VNGGVGKGGSGFNAETQRTRREAQRSKHKVAEENGERETKTRLGRKRRARREGVGSTRRRRERGEKRREANTRLQRKTEREKQREKRKDWIVRGSRERRGQESPSLAEWDGNPGKKNAPTNGGMAA
jgi:hypothetical protein